MEIFNGHMTSKDIRQGEEGVECERLGLSENQAPEHVTRELKAHFRFQVD